MSTAADDLISEPWESLSVVDVSIIGLIGTLQVFALLVCVHLLRWRKWPPYVTKSPGLVVIATVSGVLWTFATAVSHGYIERDKGDVLAACDFERFLSWSTLCVHTVAFFIRVYRMWKILIRHDSNMWHTEHQVMFMSSVSLIPVIATWISPRSGVFDETANACLTTTFSSLVVLFMDLLGFLAICFLWFVCARQLRTVRKQFNEYVTMKYTLLYMTIVLASYVGLVLFLLADDLVLQRRVAVFYPLLTTYILLWGSIREPFLMKMLGDDEYLFSYTKGFSELPSPAQLKASLEEQLSVGQLREEFRRYIRTKVAQELVDFYLDSLDREEVTGFFERQAVTMRIVERYIREGAPDQVNISGECRERILATDVTAYDIFDEARIEVLAVMETNFRRDFVATEGFQRILDASEEEQRELRMLRAGGMLPAGSPSMSSPDAAHTPASSSPLPAGQRRKPPESPPFLEGIKEALKKLPSLVKNAKAASEARRRRRAGKSGARVGSAMRVSADSIGASGSGDRNNDERDATTTTTTTTTDSDLALALRLQEEENARLDARPVTRREVGRAAATAAAAAASAAPGDVELGERGGSRAAGHAAGLGVKLAGRRVGGAGTDVADGGGGFAPRVGPPVAGAVPRGRSIDDLYHVQDGSVSSDIPRRASHEWTSSTARAVDGTAGAGLEFSHSNRLYRTASGGSGLAFHPLDDDTGDSSSNNNSPGDSSFGSTAREFAL